MNQLMTALATPYVDGKIDLNSYERLVSYQLERGVDSLLAIGTTAEAQLLSHCEKKLLVAVAKGLAGKASLFVGIEGRSTADAVKDAVDAKNWGATGLLITPPAFCKCTDEGYMQHIRAIASEVDIPLMLYNAPSRCGYTLDEDIVAELSDVAPYVKDAGSDMMYTSTVAKSSKVLCGNELVLSQSLQNGAIGCVSVVSNVAPMLTKRALDGEISPLYEQLAKLSMLEVNPIAIKYMLYKKRLFTSYEVRLPLTKANEQTRKLIDETWSDSIE